VKSRSHHLILQKSRDNRFNSNWKSLILPNSLNMLTNTLIKKANNSKIKKQ